MRVYALVAVDGRDLSVFTSKATMEADARSIWPKAERRAAGPSYYSELIQNGAVVARGYCRALVTD